MVKRNKDMKNFEFEHEGKTYWYSRSLAVNCVLFYRDPLDPKWNWYVLVNKRGQGCEFNKGLWNVPGGFIDFNETAEECACRECKEETGYIIDPSQLQFISLETDPKKSKRQTMLAIYSAFVYDAKKEELTNTYSEKGEVEEIEWVPLKDLDSRKWTHGQVRMIKDTFEALVNKLTREKSLLIEYDKPWE